MKIKRKNLILLSAVLGPIYVNADDLNAFIFRYL